MIEKWRIGMGKMSESFFKSSRNDEGETFRYTNDSRFMKYSEGITGKNFPAELFSIVAIFAEDCDYRISAFYSDSTRLFIRGYHRGNECQLMLRVHDDELNVASISFIHQRKGNMTKIYGILKKIRKKYHLDPIKIECVCSQGLKNWCEKNGFVKDPIDHLSYIEPY